MSFSFSVSPNEEVLSSGCARPFQVERFPYSSSGLTQNFQPLSVYSLSGAGLLGTPLKESLLALIR